MAPLGAAIRMTAAAILDGGDGVGVPVEGAAVACGPGTAERHAREQLHAFLDHLVRILWHVRFANLSVNVDEWFPATIMH